ncbi:TPR-MalT domain-containing protein [Sulfidibacter corallicola]|uniref:Tetratricopeptide repeat-containing protein n=1 Tax=Sulfidibacter corallicola TaxID=2818388 RepID=A0A8A4THF1_SULCO|nr:hypothetical protein [Sulfidibacter corallicola]QTD49489.1 hypothetical protein J3U87_28215 [Sulfidibacter corallicola]
MLKLFDAMRTEFQHFVEEDRHRTMVISCSDTDIAYPLKVLRDVEASNPYDVYMIFCDNFTDPHAFADVVMERIREEHAIAVEWQIKDGRVPLGDLPESLFDPERPPIERMAEAVDTVRAWFPPEGDNRLVWVLAPMEIKNADTWSQWGQQLTAHFQDASWLRLMFRSSAKLAKLVEKGADNKIPAWVKQPNVRVYGCDFGPETIDQSLADQAEDPEEPEENRMNATLMMAIKDTGYNRKDAAESKFMELLAYGQRTENHAMQAMSMMGMGDLNRRNNDLDQACYWYECAVPPSIESKQTFTMFLVVKNLAETYFAQKRYPEAEEAYLQAARLAQAHQESESFARMIDGNARSRAKQKNMTGAVDRWDSAALICREFEHTDFLKEVLKELKKGYEQLGNREAANQVAAEMATLKAGGSA